MGLWGNAVNSVTGGDSTVTIGGTTTDPTVAVNAIAESKVTGLTTDLAARQLGMTIVGPKTSNYTAAANEFVLVDTTSGNVTITFPTAPANGTRNGAKQTVRGGTNVVNLALGGSDVFNVAGGSNTGSLTMLNQGALLQYLSSASIFATISADLPLSQLDTRYGMAGAALAVGQEVFPREQITANNLSSGTGSLRLTYFTARKSETSTQVRVITGSTPAGATPTLCRIGLYSIDTSDNGTLVASIANDTTLFAASAAYTRSWSSSYAMVAGQRYALGLLVVTAATAPNWCGATALTPNAQSEFNLNPRVCANFGSQSDLPSSFTAGAVGNGTTRHYGVILP